MGIRKSRHSRRRLPPRRSHTEFAFGDRTGVRRTLTPRSVTPLSNSFGEDAIPIVDHESVRMVAWQRLPQLLQGPFCGGMSGHVVVENSPRSYFHDHEDVKSAETGRDRDKEVACHDHLGVVADEGEPSLLRIWFSSGASILQVFPNRSGRNPDAEFEFQFVGDAFLAPSRILGGHLSDQLPEVLGQAGSSDWLGLPAPEQSKSFAVPTDERIRLHVHQRIAPREYSAQGRHRPPSGVVGASRSNLSLLEQRPVVSGGRDSPRPVRCGNAPRGQSVGSRRTRPKRMSRSSVQRRGRSVSSP